MLIIVRGFFLIVCVVRVVLLRLSLAQKLLKRMLSFL